MNATVDIGLGGLLAVYLLLFIPLWFNWRLKLGLNKELLWTVLRMSVQLLLVGYYLEYLFRWNRPGLNLLWLLVMLLVANVTTLKRSKLPVRQLLLGETVASLGGFGAILLYFMLMILQVKPWYDAAYLIPVGGMILGNNMRSNVIALERFYNGLHERQREFTALLLLGATPQEAARPFFAEALRATLLPQLATMGTLGIVSLPGMMTGQMLGGVSPLLAIKYQLAIMIAILVAMQLSAYCSLWLSSRSAFDCRGNLKFH